MFNVFDVWFNVDVETLATLASLATSTRSHLVHLVLNVYKLLLQTINFSLLRFIKRLGLICLSIKLVIYLDNSLFQAIDLAFLSSITLTLFPHILINCIYLLLNWALFYLQLVYIVDKLLMDLIIGLISWWRCRPLCYDTYPIINLLYTLLKAINLFVSNLTTLFYFLININNLLVDIIYKLINLKSILLQGWDIAVLETVKLSFRLVFNGFLGT